MSYHSNEGGGGDAEKSYPSNEGGEGEGDGDSEPSTTGTWGRVVTDNGEGDTRPTLVDCFVGAGDYRCRLTERISSGSFGDVYRGRMEADGEEVAVKAEKSEPWLTPMLLNEGNIYRQLEGGPGIPRVYWYGMFPPGYNSLVMHMLGPSLQQMFKKQRCRFSLKTVLLLADQMLNTLEFVHRRGFIHRDISSNNFMLGSSDPSRIYLIDYGHSKKYATGFYYKPVQRRLSIVQTFVGTPRFASINTHMGKEACRKDDLESLAYLFVYFLRGTVPWQGLRIVESEVKLAKILQIKASTPPAVLCEGLPEEFACFLEVLRYVGQFDAPPYAQIQATFADLARRENIAFDGQFDWVKRAAAETNGNGCDKTES